MKKFLTSILTVLAIGTAFAKPVGVGSVDGFNIILMDDKCTLVEQEGAKQAVLKFPAKQTSMKGLTELTGCYLEQDESIFFLWEDGANGHMHKSVFRPIKSV
jgi:hypothetical protein